MWNTIVEYPNDTNQFVDFEQIERELLDLKFSLQTAYIDRRAKDNDMNEDLLEEIKT
jgi:hypothetical protein